MKRLALPVIGLAAALTLAGCVGEPPAILPAPGLEQQAAVLHDQADRITDETFEQLAQADASLDASGLTRIAGDALTVRAAQYKVAAAVPEEAPEVIPSELQAVYVSAADTWPRVLVGVTNVPGEKLTPIVAMWVQDSVDTDYTLRAWAHMIPGASLPAMPSDVTGAEQLSLDDATLAATPRSVIENYVEYLRQGASSDLAAQFGKDTYAEQIFAARDTLTSAASGVGGSYVDTIQPAIDGAYSLRTSDGGALVFAPVDIASSFAVTNAKVSVPAADAALVEGTLTNKVTHRYRDFIVFHIPGPGTGGQVHVVAADHHLVKVTAD